MYAPLAPLRDFVMTPAEVVNLQLAAYNRRDVVAFVATYAEDVAAEVILTHSSK